MVTNILIMLVDFALKIMNHLMLMMFIDMLLVMIIHLLGRLSYMCYCVTKGSLMLLRDH